MATNQIHIGDKPPNGFRKSKQRKGRESRGEKTEFYCPGATYADWYLLRKKPLAERRMGSRSDH